MKKGSKSRKEYRRAWYLKNRKRIAAMNQEPERKARRAASDRAYRERLRSIRPATGF